MAKAKFDSAKMKQALAAHAEKIGFGAAFVLMALLLYYGFAVKPYMASGSMNAQAGLATEPKELSDIVRRIETRVNGPENKTPQAFDMAKDGVVLPGEEPKKVIDRLLLADVSPAVFNGVEWNKPLFESKQRRREPEYLAVRDLRAAYYHAPVDMNLRGAAENNNGRVVARGREWITVTGVVPLADQTIEYTKAFQNALDTTTNALPEYPIYQLQRTVVDAANATAAVVWTDVQPVDLNVFVTEEMGAWSGTGPEYVDPKSTRAPLTQPLPVLSNGDYGDWAAHPPEIPRSGVAPSAPAAPGAAPAGNGIFGAVAAPAAQPQNAPNPAAADKDKQPQYLLFRFLDFQVEPLKYYRYRVKLVLKNPNFGLEASHLDKPELAQGDTRETPWSQETPAIGVPIHERFFAGTVGTVNGDAEPEANVGIRRWHAPLGADIYYEWKDKYRGAWLNLPGVEVAYVVPRDRRGTKGPATAKPDAMLADFAWERNTAKLRGPTPPQGGDPRQCLHPAELLVMNGRGELSIQTELGDTPLRDEKAAIEAGGSGPAPGGAGGAAMPPGNGNAAVNVAAPAAGGTSTGTAAPTPTAAPSATGPEDPRRVLRLR